MVTYPHHNHHSFEQDCSNVDLVFTGIQSNLNGKNKLVKQVYFKINEADEHMTEALNEIKWTEKLLENSEAKVCPYKHPLL